MPQRLGNWRPEKVRNRSVPAAIRAVTMTHPHSHPDSQSQFGHARARLTIGSLDVPMLTVTAQYNPSELELTKEIPFGEDAGLGVTASADSQRTAAANSGASKLEFNGSKGRTLKVEMMFDGFETGHSIEPQIELLDRLSSSRDPSSTKEELRRPHNCIVAWGTGNRSIPPFRCAITSLTVKYTVFSTHGVPLRAMVTVMLKEVAVVELGATARTVLSASNAAARALVGRDASAPISSIAARISGGVRMDAMALVDRARRVL